MVWPTPGLLGHPTTTPPGSTPNEIVMNRPTVSDWALLAVVPALLSSNLIFGRGLVGQTGPFTLALLRWGGTLVVLLPLLWRDRVACRALLRHHFGLWVLAGTLGMVICGGGVYWSLARTTATNATLIYATSPLFLLLLQRFAGRPIAAREALGMAVAFAGIAIIALRGDWQRAAGMRLETGDLGILAASIAWAGYTLLLRRPAFAVLSSATALAVMSASGVVLLVAPAIAELAVGAPLPHGVGAWTMIGGMVLLSSIAAFWGLQRSVRRVGAATTALTTYLMAPYSAAMAAAFLGERLEGFHFAGIVLVLSGLALATLRRSASSASSAAGSEPVRRDA